MSYGAVTYEKPKECDEDTHDGPMIELDCHVQVLNDTTLQDSNSVVAIVLKSLQDYKRAHPEVQKVILKADNAGCYHCVATVARLWSQRKSIEGLELIGIHFGEPGKGKSICDRHFAIIRMHVRRCVKEGHDANTPRSFAENICRNGGIANTTVQLGEIVNEKAEQKSLFQRLIPDISKYFEFMFEDEGVRVRRLPNFGRGKLIQFSQKKMLELSKVDNLPKFDREIVNMNDLDNNFQCKKKTTIQYHTEGQAKSDIFGANVQQINNVEITQEDEADDDKKVFYCNNLLCQKAFLRYKAKLSHMSDRAKCVVRVQKKSSRGQFVDKYISKNGISKEYQGKTYQEMRGMVFQKGMLPDIDPIFLKFMRENPNYGENPTRGHALPISTPNKPFSADQKAFLKEAFDVGIVTPHRKKKPAQVVKEMREAKKSDGTRRFETADWLTETQIRSFFTRIAAERRHKTDEPTVAQIEDTENLRQAVAQEELISEIEQNLTSSDGVSNDDPHPLIADQFNLCELAKSRRDSSSVQESKFGDIEQKKLKKALNSIGIDDFGGRKATMKNMADIIVKYVDEHCGCSMF